MGFADGSGDVRGMQELLARASDAFGAVKGTCWGAGFVRGDMYAERMWCVRGFWHAGDLVDVKG